MKHSSKVIKSAIYYQLKEAASSISQINNKVIEVAIEVSVVYSSFVGQVKKEYKIVLKQDDKYMCRIQCPNNDCTEGYIDLSNEIFAAVKDAKYKEGTIKCSGQEKKYEHTNSFHCDTTLFYKIKPSLLE